MGALSVADTSVAELDREAAGVCGDSRRRAAYATSGEAHA